MSFSHGVVVHEVPGVFIKGELETRGWSQRDLAFILGQTEQQLNPLLSGKRSITADMARLLGDAFGVDPQFFLNLQSQYDLQHAKTPDPAVKTRAELQDKYPVREMIRRGWIKDGQASLLQLQVLRFYETSPEWGGEPVRFAAKKTHYSSNTPQQIAWVYRARQLARAIDAPLFSYEKLTATVAKLKSLLIDPEAVKLVPGLLNSCGVRFVVVEALPGAKIDGACTWLDDRRPVIALSTLHDRLDNFWFVLRHEIEHVLQGHGKDGVGKIDNLSAEGLDGVRTDDEEEAVANSSAADFLVPQTKMDSFYARKHPYFAEKDVLGFSAVLGVHPAIVVGQLQKRMQRYDYLRKYQVSVRKHLSASAVMDGWGHTIDAEL